MNGSRKPVRPVRIDLTMPCPFCRGTFGVTDPERAEREGDPIAVTHTVPPCREYVERDAMDYVRTARERLQKLAEGREN